MVERLDQHAPVSAGQAPERGGNELPVQDLVQPGVIPGILGRLRRDHHRPRPGGPVSVDQQVPGDPEQPWADRPVVGDQLRQVTPGADEGFLDDVIRGRRVMAEALGVAAQGIGVMEVEISDRRIGVGARWQPAAGGTRCGGHVYYHG